MSPVTLVGTVRNRATAPIATNAVRLRLHVLAGLDYLSGDTSPWSPALEPGATASFKWQVQPTSQNGPLVASLSIETPDQAPNVRLVAIPHLSSQPPAEPATVSPIPAARAAEGGGILENNRVRARLITSESDVPILILSAHTAGGWRQVGVSLPLAELCSGEGGQLPWWEMFKNDEMKALQSKDEASLALGGSFGVRWRATVALKLKADSSVIDFELQAAPTRQIKLSGIRICPLLAGDGSFGAASGATLIGKPSGPNTVSAVRWGEITFGRLERSSMPGKDWQSIPIGPVEGPEYNLLGIESRAPESPLTYDVGSIVKLRARLFALTPSTTINDAYKVFLPADTSK